MKMVAELPYIVTARPDRYAYYTAAEALASALSDTRNCHATDLRDKLYAILPLLQQMNGKDSRSFAKAYEIIKMDYRLTTTQVFVNAAKYLLNAFSLRILEDVVGPSTLPMLPSWVPDWSLGFSVRKRQRPGDYGWRYFEEHDKSKKGGYKILETEIDNGELLHQLQIEGHYVGAIASIGGECDLFNDKFPLVEWFAMVPDLQALNESYNKYETARRALCDTINPGCSSWDDVIHVIEERIRVYHEGTEARVRFFIKNMGRRPPIDGTTLRDFIECGHPSSIRLLIQEVLDTCDGQRLFLTDTGYVGLGSRHCQIGDCLYMIEAVSKYYILRPSNGIGKQVKGRQQEKFQGTASKMRYVGGGLFENRHSSVTIKLADAEKLIVW
jgi:hypothetical protein